MDKVAGKKINKDVQGGMTRASLKSLSPLTFTITEQLEIYGQMIVLPKYRVFTAKDIGKSFVFFKNQGGQTYYYLYEASQPQGSNGIPYHFTGKMRGTISGANLIGTCPDGGVVVTQGSLGNVEIEWQEHTEGVD